MQVSAHLRPEHRGPALAALLAAVGIPLVNVVLPTTAGLGRHQ